ncbi:hypothetical protein MBT84_34945 [Streptomyces sp. MBT84]|nr:hypothetical protein [Streptomyces sp. MBT84]
MTDDLADRLVVTLDLDTVDDKAAFMERIAGALGLPDWFGRNWDALADSLTDRTVWPPAAVGRGLLLVVRGGGATRRHGPRSGTSPWRCSPRWSGGRPD